MEERKMCSGVVGQGITTRAGRSALVTALVATLLGPAAVRAQGLSGGGDEAMGLAIEKVGASERGFHVVSTLVVGPTESVLWDAQNWMSDGRRVADRIAATGTRLKAVILSHADHDHYMGAMAVLERFPGTPVYMTRAGLDDFLARSPDEFARAKARGPDPDVPDRLVQPELLPEGGLDVDGFELTVLEGLTGDVRAPVSTALWIPSLRTVLAGDLVFDGIHPWLGDADRASRLQWRASLRRLASLDPVAVVPGHKRDLTRSDSPAQIEFMIRYLDDYDAAMETAATPDDVAEAMVAKYPDLVLPVLMAYGARTWFKR